MLVNGLLSRAHFVTSYFQNRVLYLGIIFANLCFFECSLLISSILAVVSFCINSLISDFSIVCVMDYFSIIILFLCYQGFLSHFKYHSLLFAICNLMHSFTNCVYIFFFTSQ